MTDEKKEESPYPPNHKHNYIEIATGLNPAGQNATYMECLNPGCDCRTYWRVDE